MAAPEPKSKLHQTQNERVFARKEFDAGADFIEEIIQRLGGPADATCVYRNALCYWWMSACKNERRSGSSFDTHNKPGVSTLVSVSCMHMGDTPPRAHIRVQVNSWERPTQAAAPSIE